MTRYGILLGKKPPKPQVMEYFMGIDPGVSSTEVIVGHIVTTKSELSTFNEYAFQIDLQEQLMSPQSLEILYMWLERIYHRYIDLGKLKVRMDQMTPAFWSGNHFNIPYDRVKITSSWRIFLFDACRAMRVFFLLPADSLKDFQQAYDLALSLAVENLQAKLEPMDFDPDPTIKGIGFGDRYL